MRIYPIIKNAQGQNLWRKWREYVLQLDREIHSLENYIYWNNPNYYILNEGFYDNTQLEKRGILVSAYGWIDINEGYQKSSANTYLYINALKKHEGLVNKYTDVEFLTSATKEQNYDGANLTLTLPTTILTSGVKDGIWTLTTATWEGFSVPNGSYIICNVYEEGSIDSPDGEGHNKIENYKIIRKHNGGAYYTYNGDQFIFTPEAIDILGERQVLSLSSTPVKFNYYESFVDEGVEEQSRKEVKSYSWDEEDQLKVEIKSNTSDRVIWTMGNVPISHELYIDTGDIDTGEIVEELFTDDKRTIAIIDNTAIPTYTISMDNSPQKDLKIHVQIW